MDYRFFIDKMPPKNLSYSKLANQMGLSKQAIFYKLKCKQPLRIDEFILLCKIFNVRPDEALKHINK